MNKLVTIAVCLGAGVLAGCYPATRDQDLAPLTSSSPETPAEKATYIESLVKKIVAEQFGVAPEEVVATTRFVDDLDADSLDLVELVMAFEDELGVAIPDEDAKKIVTVGDAIAYLETITRR